MLRRKIGGRSKNDKNIYSFCTRNFRNTNLDKNIMKNTCENSLKTTPLGSAGLLVGRGGYLTNQDLYNLFSYRLGIITGQRSDLDKRSYPKRIAYCNGVIETYEEILKELKKNIELEK